jgi:hypothetical protein
MTTQKPYGDFIMLQVDFFIYIISEKREFVVVNFFVIYYL